MSEFIKDDSFEVENTRNYILSIQVNLDGFSFLLTNPDNRRIVAFKNTSLLISNEILIPRRLKEWLDGDEILKKHFKSVRLFYFNDNFSLIPSHFFEIEKQKQLTSVLFEKKSNNHFIENNIESLNSVLYYPVPQEVFTTMNNFFNKNIEVIHPLVQIIQNQIESAKQYISFIVPCKNFFYLTVFEKDKLLLANSFQTVHSNDLVYNVLNSFQQLKISRSNTEMILAGSVNQNNEIRDLLNPYFSRTGNLNLLGTVVNPEIINNDVPLYLSLI